MFKDPDTLPKFPHISAGDALEILLLFCHVRGNEAHTPSWRGECLRIAARTLMAPSTAVTALAPSPASRVTLLHWVLPSMLDSPDAQHFPGCAGRGCSAPLPCPPKVGIPSSYLSHQDTSGRWTMQRNVLKIVLRPIFALPHRRLTFPGEKLTTQKSRLTPTARPTSASPSDIMGQLLRQFSAPGSNPRTHSTLIRTPPALSPHCIRVPADRSGALRAVLEPLAGVRHHADRERVCRGGSGRQGQCEWDVSGQGCVFRKDRRTLALGRTAISCPSVTQSRFQPSAHRRKHWARSEPAWAVGLSPDIADACGSTLAGHAAPAVRLVHRRCRRARASRRTRPMWEDQEAGAAKEAG